MMSDRQQRENLYMSSPIDRSRVGQQKVEDIQKQILTLENQQKDRANLIHKLNRLQEVEKGKKEIQEKVLERNSRNNSPVAPSRFLQSELDRLYGRDSELERARASVVDRNAVEMVIQHRTKEFSAKQQEAALTAKYLDRERKKLQEARQRVHEQRQLLQNYNDERPLSDSGLTRPSDLMGRDGQFSLPTAEAQGVDSYIDQTVHKLPTIMDKIWKMREDLEQHHRFYRKPYNGELGIRSYQHWQLPDYFLCKDIVDDIVEDFLNLYFRHDDVVEPGTYKALLEDEKQWRDKQSDALSEKRAVQLIAEELLLDETGDVIDEVIKEMHHMYGTFRNMTDTMLIGEAEMVATGKDHERDQSERAYNMVTKGYFNVKANRGQHRKEVWGHSQYAQNKVKKRQINRKKDGYEEVEEVEDLEEEPKRKPKMVPVAKPKRKRRKKREEDDVDAPDLTILDFNTIPLVSLRSLPPSYIDSTEIRQEKEAFRRFKRRELDYWNKMVPQTHSLTFHAKCNGIHLIKVSPNHRFVAIGTFHGDLFVCDALTMPWRPFRALAFHAKKDRRLIDIAWSLDSTRIITIDIMGYLQVASIVVGHANSADAVKMALPRDDKGIYAHDVQTLLELDVMREDFIFQQGTMADEGVLNDIALLPRKAAFFPSISFLGSQNDIIIGMEEGDMLKCNIQNSIKFTQIRSEMKSMKEAPRIYKPLLVKDEEASDLNTIGQNVEAELLRGHKKSVVYIGFVEYLNAMITVDGQGYIYKWKYNEKTKSSFGWYTPARKYKIERAKIMYKESGTDKPKTLTIDELFWSSLPGIPKKMKWPVKVVKWLPKPLVYCKCDDAYFNVSRDQLVPFSDDVNVIETFKNKGIELGAVRAYDSQKKICNELHLKQPEQITSVNMRKYTATISQIFDMSTQEQQWLTNHLGHSMEIHKVHYRQTSGVIERVDIAKLMLLQEFEIARKYAGKKLADIDMQGDGTAPLNGVSDDEMQPDIQTVDTYDEYEFLDEDSPEEETKRKSKSQNHSAPGKKPKTRQEIATERKRVQNTLDNMQLGEPWHEQYMEEEDIIVEIYAPRGVIPETGAMFHILYKNADTDQLSTYVTRLYKPVRVRCTQILKVLGSPSSTELVIMLLFSAYPPKQAHITVFIVDLKTFELRDFRKDIPLTQKEYAAMSQNSVVACDITRTFGPTGTEYLFLMISGQLVGYSVTTGQLVIKTGQMGFEFDNTDYTDLDPIDDEDEDKDDEENINKPTEKRQGCVISPSQLPVPEDSQCTAVCFEGKIFCVVYAPKFNKMVVVTFEDKNVYADRRAMWKTYTGLKDSKLVPAELRLDTANWKLPDVQHPAVAARKIIMAKLDMEMRKAGLVRDHPKTIRKILLNDKVENYRMLEKDVTDSALLEKEGVMAKRAPSRLSTAPIVEEENF